MPASKPSQLNAVGTALGSDTRRSHVARTLKELTKQPPPGPHAAAGAAAVFAQQPPRPHSLVCLQRPAVHEDVPDVLPHAELLIKLVVPVSGLHVCRAGNASTSLSADCVQVLCEGSQLNHQLCLQADPCSEQSDQVCWEVSPLPHLPCTALFPPSQKNKPVYRLSSEGTRCCTTSG